MVMNFNSKKIFSILIIVGLIVSAKGQISTGDTLLNYYWAPNGANQFDVNADDAGNFLVENYDNDFVMPSGYCASMNPAFAMSWMKIYSSSSNNRYIAAQSCFADNSVVSNDNYYFGNITIPENGAILKWRHMFWDASFRDGYEILVDTSGAGTTFDVTLYVLPDNHNSTSMLGVKEWQDKELCLEAEIFGGKKCYFKLHHNAHQMYIVGLDDILILNAPEINSFIINKTGDSLVVDDLFESYQWYKDNVILNAEISNSLLLTDTGKYDLIVTIGCSSKKETFVYVEPNETAIQNLSNFKLDVAPNPFNLDLKITSDDNKIEFVEIYDFTGKIVNLPIKISDVQARLNTEDIEEGVYFVKIKTRKGVSLKKVIKKH